MSSIDQRFYKDVIETTKLLQENSIVRDFEIVGSALYHPEPKDLDFLVLCKGQSFNKFDLDTPMDDSIPGPRWAFGSEWALCSGEYDIEEDTTWGAIRRGNVNLILTVDQGWYERMLVASEVCRALKLMDKGDRIIVHRVIRGEYTADEANARRDGSL